MMNPERRDTGPLLEEILSERILVLDGAMGSMIYAHEPTEEDYRGARFAQPSRRRSRTAPRCWS